ncbi:PAS domain-containing protein [Emcibacter sp.]|uniref:PAS domain-containing protein n=1 Tax=Emcibacter sp. TaxID=1979954 RepID=UPI002AA902E1|nr:PAS domain-containing protein [Emcibacter sp.]
MFDDEGYEIFVKTDFTPADFNAKIHHILYDHWNDIRGDKPLPSRADFNPAAVAPALPYIFVLEVHKEPMRFKFRLTGTETVEVMGVNAMGHWIDEFPHTEEIIDRYKWLVENRRPYYNSDRLHWAVKDFHHYTALTLPFSDDGENVNILISTNHYC